MRTITTMPLRHNGHRTHRREVEVSTRDNHDKPVVMAALRCAVCAVWLKYQVVDDHVHVPDPCAYPDGITTEITLDVPSGRLVVADSLRSVYDWDDAEITDYNTTLGQAQAIEVMAGIGCAYGPVGNTCPGLWATGPDNYIIARPSDDDSPSAAQGTCLASICTDLWAYSIADFEHWLSRGGDPDEVGSTVSVVSVTPGTYRFTHHSGERGFDSDSDAPVIFAHIERVEAGSVPTFRLSTPAARPDPSTPPPRRAVHRPAPPSRRFFPPLVRRIINAVSPHTTRGDRPKPPDS